MQPGPRGFPPVELYQVGDAYFIVDGHHRVSVAKTMGSSRIEAWVKEFITPVLEPDESIEQVVLKSGLADFLEATGLQPDRVGAFRTTVPNGYERMLEHISVHRYFLGVDRGAPVPWDDAVRSWREQFYEPIVAQAQAGRRRAQKAAVARKAYEDQVADVQAGGAGLGLGGFCHLQVMR